MERDDEDDQEGDGKKGQCAVGVRYEISRTEACKSSSIVSFLRHGRHRPSVSILI